ncbi:MAG: GAF domain-containing protein [Armatimonadetes bacterium]|nr:GAF domain-containing protein [Armatimonadota bacterium]
MDSASRLIRAVQKASKRLSSADNIDLLLRDALTICVDAVGASGGTMYLHDEAENRLTFRHVLPSNVESKLPSKDIADDFGMAGAAFQLRQTISREFEPKPDSELSEFERATGVPVRTMISVPLMLEDEQPIGVVQLINKKDGRFSENDGAILETVAAVATMAFVNARLTEEVARASSLLGMGKVSHDIGNLAAALQANVLNTDLAIKSLERPNASPAVLDVLKESAEEVKSCTERIVGYAQLISDLSAGRELRPQFKVAPMADTIAQSVSFYEEAARNEGVKLCAHLDYAAPQTMHDPLYVFRVVQNLVGNALKAVKEGKQKEPEVEIRYSFTNNHHILEVEDNGPGMTKQTAARILKGTARSQWENASGSGWGMRIVLELAVVHGAKVEINSTLGEGSTFRVVFPQTNSSKELRAPSAEGNR